MILPNLVTPVNDISYPRYQGSPSSSTKPALPQRDGFFNKILARLPPDKKIVDRAYST
jgi:hypothetical protein